MSSIDVRAAVLRRFEVDAKGQIKDPGRFEGQQLYVPYFHQLIMEGAGEPGGRGVMSVKVETVDRLAFPELGNLGRVYLWLREDGDIRQFHPLGSGGEAVGMSVTSLAKTQCVKSAAFREWLRPDGCAAKGPRCYGGLEFHHEKRTGARGSDPLLGGSDFCGLWLCWHHHMLAQGRFAEFERDLGMPVWQRLFRQFYAYAVERGLLEVER